MTVFDVEVRASKASFAVERERGSLAIGVDAHRPLRLEADLAKPAVIRDALTVLARVFEADLRFKASDRSDYLAFLLKQGKKATKELWEAQKAFLEERYGEAASERSPLDPLVTCDHTGLTLEVLSADESAYGRLTIKAEAYTTEVMEPGTSHLRVDGLIEAPLLFAGRHPFDHPPKVGILTTTGGGGARSPGGAPTTRP